MEEHMHEHEHEHGCCCGDAHGHDHDHGCGCGDAHDHDHGHDHGCGCGDAHGHSHGCSCGDLHAHDHDHGSSKHLLPRIFIAAALWVPVFLISEGIWKVNIHPAALFCLFLVAYLIVGYDVIWEAVEGIRHKEFLDEHFLMTIATVGAIALGEYGEGVAVMLLYQVGEYFQSLAVGKSRRSIAELMDIRPDVANLEVAPAGAEFSGAEGAAAGNAAGENAGSGSTVTSASEIRAVPPEEVPIGSIIVIRPGEKVPLDGIVEEGSARLDTAALTGESSLRTAEAGDAVLSGCVNMEGTVRVRTTADFGESTASKVLELVEHASSRKSRAENFITRFARWYTPVVCVAALVLAFVPPLISLAAGLGATVGAGALFKTWLIRACTFLVISCPCAIVISVPLSFFAGIGAASRRGVLVKGSNYLEALADVRVVAFDKTGTLTKGSASRGADGVDEVKESSAEAIRDLREANIRRMVVLSGDKEEVVTAIAGRLGLSEYRAELLPADKVTEVERLLSEKTGNEKVAFVGDGINDAPVLARADVGIAMGALGTDAAIEAADVVLMDDDPRGIARAMKISQKCLRIVRQNIAFALGAKLICLVLAALGIGGMWLAVGADVGVLILCVLNAVRALRL